MVNEGKTIYHQETQVSNILPLLLYNDRTFAISFSFALINLLGDRNDLLDCFIPVNKFLFIRFHKIISASVHLMFYISQINLLATHIMKLMFYVYSESIIFSIMIYFCAYNHIIKRILLVNSMTE